MLPKGSKPWIARDTAAAAVACPGFLVRGGNDPWEGVSWGLSPVELPVEVSRTVASRRPKKIPWQLSEQAVLQMPLRKGTGVRAQAGAPGAEK